MGLTGCFNMESSVLYLDSPGKKNTDKVLEVVAQRAKRGGLTHVVVASDSGETGMKAIAALKGSGVQVVVVTCHCGSEKEGVCEMSKKMEDDLQKAGARLVRATHALSGVERSINRKIGGSSRVETVAELLRALFGQGMKVAIEITVMAADNGAIPCGELEVVAVGGTATGADTAIVVRPAHSNAFFNMQVREILAIPRKH